MDFLTSFASIAWQTTLDVLPIVSILVAFQALVLRRKLPNLRRIVAGFLCVLLGLTLFLIGLQDALFPIGETMARQLTAPATSAANVAEGVVWSDYWLVYAFAGGDRLRYHGGGTVADRGGLEGSGSLRRHGECVGAAHRRCPRRGPGRGARLLSHRHRHASALVHRCRLRRGDPADVPRRRQHRAHSLTTAAG